MPTPPTSPSNSPRSHLDLASISQVRSVVEWMSSQPGEDTNCAEKSYMPGKVWSMRAGQRTELAEVPNDEGKPTGGLRTWRNISTLEDLTCGETVRRAEVPAKAC